MDQHDIVLWLDDISNTATVPTSTVIRVVRGLLDRLAEAEKRLSQHLGCYDCGLKYGGESWVETYIPESIWKQISPHPDGGGILCVSCIARRLRQKGIQNVPVWFTGTEPLTAMQGEPPDVGEEGK
jgi:hypothetical protein